MLIDVHGFNDVSNIPNVNDKSDRNEDLNGGRSVGDMTYIYICDINNPSDAGDGFLLP